MLKAAEVKTIAFDVCKVNQAQDVDNSQLGNGIGLKD